MSIRFLTRISKHRLTALPGSVRLLPSGRANAVPYPPPCPPRASVKPLFSPSASHRTFSHANAPPLLAAPCASPPLPPLHLQTPLPTPPPPRPRLRVPSPELLGQSALRRISEKLRSLGYLETSLEAAAPAPSTSDTACSSSPGEIFLPTPARLPRHRVGSTLDPSWATGDGEADPAARRRRRSKRGRDAGAAGASAPPSAAELALPRDELRRLQGIGISVRKRLKVGKAGVTEGIVNGIHERWRNAEVVKIRCEDVWALNMRRTHEILEVSSILAVGH
ncbi:hypothetical protein PR202_ga20035 [Eleusine coracana subsp. coracana]|uniref:CRM domain-containing protein n=1 Tax=Eleusine coracana subsp. coracana TaxID=191504 RepID=A0AAV5CX51_ELECO|nr:hypothetical protein PR202_ga20035 [Eleusine coracana subsp. coracana]